MSESDRVQRIRDRIREAQDFGDPDAGIVDRPEDEPREERDRVQRVRDRIREAQDLDDPSAGIVDRPEDEPREEETRVERTRRRIEEAQDLDEEGAGIVDRPEDEVREERDRVERIQDRIRDAQDLDDPDVGIVDRPEDRPAEGFVPPPVEDDRPDPVSPRVQATRDRITAETAPGITGLEDDPQRVEEIDERFQFVQDGREVSIAEFVELETERLEDEGLERDEFGIFFDEETGVLEVEFAEHRLAARQRAELREEAAEELDGVGFRDVVILEDGVGVTEEAQLRAAAAQIDEDLDRVEVTADDVVIEGDDIRPTRDIFLQQIAAEEGVDVDDIQVDPETDELFIEVEPEQERVFEEGTILGRVEDFISPEDAIEFRRETRPEQLLELAEARTIEEIDRAEEVLAASPAPGVAGPGFAVAREDADDRAVVAAGAEFARFAEPAGIALLLTGAGRAVTDELQFEVERREAAARAILDRDTPADLGDLVDLASPGVPLTPGRLDRRTEQFEAVSEFTGEAVEATGEAFEQDPVRTAARVAGGAAAFGVGIGTVRAARRAQRPARVETTDRPIGIQTDIPEPRPVGLTADAVDAAMGVRGPGRVDVARGRVQRRLDEIEAGVRQRIPDVELGGPRVGAGLVPPRVRRVEEPELPTRLDQEVLAGSPRDLMSREVTERAMIQRRQAAGEFEGAADPLAVRSPDRVRTFDRAEIEEPFFRRPTQRLERQDGRLLDMVDVAGLAAFTGIGAAQLQRPGTLAAMDIPLEQDLTATQLRDLTRPRTREETDLLARQDLRRDVREMLAIEPRRDVRRETRDLGRLRVGIRPTRRTRDLIRLRGRPRRTFTPPPTRLDDDADPIAGFDLDFGPDRVDLDGMEAIGAGFFAETVADLAGIDVASAAVDVDDEQPFGEFGFDLEADDEEAFEETLDVLRL